jgi:hypothetical protein
MENITTKYIKIIENEKDHNNNLKVKIYYDLGGFNMFTHKEKPRGYYISVTPVKMEGRDGVTLESITAFTGYYELLEPCARKSKKAEAAALEKAPVYEKIIIDHILKNSGYILED